MLSKDNKREIAFTDSRRQLPLVVVLSKKIQWLRSTVNITFIIPWTARLHVRHSYILNFLKNKPVITVFKVVELNRWKILNSVGGLLDVALKI